MATVKCNKGHIYDNALGACPICAREQGSWMSFGGGVDDFPPTMNSPTLSTNPGWMDDIGPTMTDGSSFGGNVEPTKGVTKTGFTGDEFMDGTEVDRYEPTQVAPMSGVEGFDPVVGWLICIKGPNRGKDYRLHGGTNFIGRSKEMDVYIENDMTISKRNAASISYDERTKSFFIQKGEVRNLLYVNGRPVRSDADLVIYDRIEIGGTELIFVPLCGTDFTW